MKWLILIFWIFLPEKSDGNDLFFDNLIPDVSFTLAKHLDTRCLVIFNENLCEKNFFKLTKFLAKAWSFVLATSFDIYLKYPECLRENRTCANALGIVLGWEESTGEKFAKFSRNISMADYKWLIFLSKNSTTESFLKEADIPFNAELVTARVSGENNLLLEEAYRVAENYPLRVLKYGTWEISTRKFTNLTEDYLYKRRWDMEGYPVRASTRDDFPISRLSRKSNGDFYIEGYFGSVYYILGDILNYTAVYVEAAENMTGISHNGSWSGLLGMMQRDEVDFVVGPVTILKEVTSVAGAIRPLLRSSYQIFFQQHGTVIKWNDIFKPFAKNVWLCIVIWILSAAYIFNQIYKLECWFGRETLDCEKEYNRTNSFFAFLKALCQQGNPFVPKSSSCRIIYITGYFVSTILLTAYSASLISNITTQAPRRPFDSLGTFLKDGSYTLIAIKGSTDYSYFSGANDSLRQNIYTKLMKHVDQDDLPTDKEGGLEQVCSKQKYALFITFAVTQLTAQQFSVDRNCPVLYFQTPLDTVFLTIARRKKFPYSTLIDYKLQNMAQSGVLRRLQQKVWPLMRTKKDVKFKQVTIEQVFQIQFILILGIILSLVFLAVEVRSDEGDQKLKCKAFCLRKLKWKFDFFWVNTVKNVEACQNVAYLMTGLFIVLFIVLIF